MNNNKPNDILVATINNPSVSAYDLLSSNVLGDNTSLHTKEEYKSTKFIKNAFTTDGKFDEVAFDKMYKLASDKYAELTNEEYINSLDELEYNPFDITRPKEAKTYSVGSFYNKEINPFKVSKGWSGIGSVDESPFSLREIAQQSKVYDKETDTWSEESLNDLSIKDKLFGETLVYAQYDNDGEHEDLESGYMVKHKKGDWIVNKEGNIFTEKLGKREIYGKQVVNPSDIMTTDGSIFDKFNFFDSDDREKSIAGTSFKLAAQIAPYVIPGVNFYYGGVTAAINLAAVLPTFYKALEGMLLGDKVTGATKLATAGENYLAKFVQNSISDESQDSLFNYEQMGQLVTSVFAQIYQQRAAASLATIVKSPKNQLFDKKLKELLDEPNKNFIKNNWKLKLKGVEIGEEAEKKIYASMAEKIPGLKELREQQSHMAKAFNLGYMAMVTSADIYGEAIEGGYDRRTAGFATLAATAGQYGIMMNNEMGTWFLDKTTGYDINTNKVLTRKAIKDFLPEIKKAFQARSKDGQKIALSKSFKGIKEKFNDIFLNPSELGENLFKHSIVEGVEEVTEQLVLDSTKGMIDVMSYLGLTKNQGSFGGFDNVFSKKGLENYLANLVGGMIGGPLFEYNSTKIEPKINSLFKNKIVQPEVKTSIYQLIGNGKTNELIAEINKQRKFLGNNFINLASVEGDVQPAEKVGKSEADIIADNAIGIVKIIEGIMNSNALVKTNEEIVQKAFIDHLVIEGLEKAKENFSTGVEGLVLNDYTKNLDLLVEKNLEILELQKNTTEASNNESIKQLKEEASVYKNNINDILEGKKAQHYFDRVVTYFNKDLLNSFVAVDRDSYAKIKYKKSYYDMPETGIGFTKEKVNKEWKEYKDSGDIVKDLEVAVEAILNLEQLSNEAVTKFSESGYDVQRIKSGKDLINMIATNSLFSTEKESKGASFAQFLEMSKTLGKKSGKKILPWDVITTNFFEGLLNNNFIINSNTNETITPESLEQVVEIEGNKTTKKEILKDSVNDVLALIPADNINIEVFAKTFNEFTNKVNEDFNKEIERLSIDKNILTSKLESKNGTERTQIENEISEIDQKINDINYKKLNAHVLSGFQFTNGQKNKLNILEDNLKSELEFLKLTKEKEFLKKLKDKKNLEYDSGKVLTDVESIITEKIDGKKKKTKDIIEELSQYLANNEVFNKEVLHTTLNSPTGKSTDKIKRVVTALKKDESSFSNYNSVMKNHQDSLQVIENEKSSLEEINYLFHALLKEFKEGNRDGEILELLNKTYNNSFESLSSMNVSKVFKDEELLEVLKVTSNDLSLLNNLFTKWSTYVVVRNDVESGQNPEEYWKEIGNIINSISNENVKNKISKVIKKDSEGLSTREELQKIKNVVTNMLDFKINNKSDIEVLLKSEEIFSKSNEFISNSIYDFVKEFSVSLNNDSNPQIIKLFDILKNEEYSLRKASDASNYLSDGVNIKVLQQGIDTLKMLKSVVNGFSTTTIDLNNPYGFIALRQQFAKANNTKSDVLKLKTINSDTAGLINNDIKRLENKLGFMKILLLGNSGKMYEEEEEIRAKTNDLLLNHWKEISKLNIKLAGNSVIDDLDSIIVNKSWSNEKKLMAIGESFYEKHKNISTQDRKSFLADLKKSLPYKNNAINIYSKDGSNIINKDVKQVSNNDFILYLASNLVINSKDFNIRLKQALEGEFDKSPFFTQEIAAQIAYASIVDPELFQELAKPDNDNIINTERITYLLGNTGTGKTTVEAKLLINLLKNNNPNLKVWFAAPYKDQAEKLEREALLGMDTKSFTKNTLSKKEVFEALGVADIHNNINNPANNVINYKNGYLTVNKEAYENITIAENLPNILFIDEITHFGAHELYLLNEVSKKALEQGKILKIVGIGDIAQSGYEFQGLSFNADYVSGIFAPRLSLTVRALNIQQRSNADYLSALANTTRQLWESTNDDKVILDIIGKGVSLSSYTDNEILNGSLLIKKDPGSNNPEESPKATIPDNVLKVLSKTIQKNSNTKIAILNDSLDLSDDLLDAFAKHGITDSNYKIYSPSNIQGAESDYFIFSTSLINPKTTLASKIRALNTYITRAKHATIILNDAPENLPFELIEKIDDYPRFIDPLTEEVIKENKQSRIKALTELLGEDLKIKYDYFKFESDKVEEISPSKEEGIRSLTLKAEDKLPEWETKNIPISSMKDIKDSYMIHTFYNDLNATKVHHAAEDKYSLQKKEGSFYGLNTGKVTEAELDEIINNYVKLKNNILLNKGHDEDFHINGKTVWGTTKGEFVIRKSTYDSSYNNPYKKLYGNPSQMLTTGEVFVNLFYKVKNVRDDIEYIHLATFPKLTTLENNLEGGANSELYKKYKEFMGSTNQEVVVDKDSFTIHTSTRLVTHEDAKVPREEFTIEALKKIPGIRFFSTNTNSFVDSPEINLYPNRNSPTGFSDFVNLYRKTLFNKEPTNEEFKKMFEMYAGNAYIVVSFMPKGINKGTEKNSHLQIIPLKAKQRPFEEVVKIIHNFKRLKDKKEKNPEYSVIKSLFSGSQILDLLILLAEKRPDLYTKLFEPNNDILDAQNKWNELDNNTNATVKAFIEEYYTVMKIDVNKYGNSLIYRLGYTNKHLVEVFTLILQTVKDAQKVNKSIDKKALKKALVEKIKIQSSTPWFHDFWHLFQLQNMFANMSERTDILTGLSDFAKTMSSTLSEITKFFEEEIKIAGKYVTGIYYNPPIHGKAGSDGNLTLDKSAENLNMEYLYTDLAPESPYLLLKTDFIQEGGLVIDSSIKTAETAETAEIIEEDSNINSSTDVKVDEQIEINSPNVLKESEIENISEPVKTNEKVITETAKQKKKRLEEEAKKLPQESKNVQAEIQTPIDALKQKVIMNTFYSNIFKPLNDSLEEWALLDNNLKKLKGLLDSYNIKIENTDSIVSHILNLLTSIANTTDSKNLFNYWVKTREYQLKAELEGKDKDTWMIEFFRGTDFNDFYNNIKTSGNQEGNFLENLKDLMFDSLNTTDGTELGEYASFLDDKLIKNCN